MYRFQEARKVPLQYIPRQIQFWHEHFCRYINYKSYPDNKLSKELMIKEKRIKNEEMIQEILENLREVN